MKSYILLRNNNESGPYTLQELKEFGLVSSDLVWIEGESTSWKHPSEIRGLKTIANLGIKKPLPQPKIERSAAFIAVNSAPTTLNQKPDEFFTNNPSDSAISDYFDKTNNNYYEGLIPKRTGVSLAANFFGLGVLLMGVTLCAFVVKKMVDHFEYDPSPSAQALEIKAETLPLSLSTHQAKAMNSTVQNEAPIGTSLSPTDSLSLIQTESRKPVTKPGPGTAKTLIASATSVSQPEADPLSVTNAVVTEVKETPAASEEKKTESTDAVKRSPSLQLSANDYEVGMFGGVSNLEISVSNPSPLGIAKAVVEVEFLKPNGNVVKSTTMTVENISPGGLKKVSVPDSNRGVKVRYRVVSIDAQDS